MGEGNRETKQDTRERFGSAGGVGKKITSWEDGTGAFRPAAHERKEVAIETRCSGSGGSHRNGSAALSLHYYPGFGKHAP